MRTDEMLAQHNEVVRQAERVEQAIRWYHEGLYTRTELAQITMDAGLLMQAAMLRYR